MLVGFILCFVWCDIEKFKYLLNLFGVNECFEFIEVDFFVFEVFDFVVYGCYGVFYMVLFFYFNIIDFDVCNFFYMILSFLIISYCMN